MDIDSEVGEGFNDFDVVTGNWHKGAWEEGSVGSLDPVRILPSSLVRKN